MNSSSWCMIFEGFTSRNMPCLLKRDTVVPPTGMSLSGPPQSNIDMASWAVWGKSQNSSGMCNHSFQLQFMYTLRGTFGAFGIRLTSSHWWMVCVQSQLAGRAARCCPIFDTPPLNQSTHRESRWKTSNGALVEVLRRLALVFYHPSFHWNKLGFGILAINRWTVCSSSNNCAN